MQILPVLDVMDGKVVRGVGGRRREYRPIVSRLTAATDPIGVARDLRKHCGFDELYLADLDAIMGQPPSLAVCQTLHDDKFHLWVDAGLRDLAGARALVEIGVKRIVAGLETILGPKCLSDMVAEVGAERLVFSLDLKNGEAVGQIEVWKSADPREIAQEAVALGVRRILVLDLARVGTCQGAATEELCTWLSEQFPHLDLAAGGGIGSNEDIERLEMCGVTTVLIASSLHDGRICIGRDTQRNSQNAD
jgi:phosphoribosylformimino-5-aminoimidazole carboxamide ribotide isomerase